MAVPAALSSKTVSPVLQSHKLVASFLKSQGYLETLAAFRKEAVLNFGSDEDLDANVQEEGADLKQIVEDYLSKKLKALEIPTKTLQEELDKVEVDEEREIPSKVVETIRDGTNILTVNEGILPRRTWDSTALRFKSEFLPCIFTTSVDRTIKSYSLPHFSLLDTFSFPSPILTLAISPVSTRLLVASTMEGSTFLLDLVTRKTLRKLKDHTKYIVRTIWSPNGRWIVTLGYDKIVNIYEVVKGSSEDQEEHIPETLLDGEEPDELATFEPVDLLLRKTINTKNNPEAAIFLPNSDYLVWSARDDHILHYLKMPKEGGKATSTVAVAKTDHEEEKDWAASGYNLNENNDAWVSFSVLYITIHPTLPLLSLQTSTTNSRILLYPFHSASRLSTIFTTSSQSDYSTPRHTWFPDGSLVGVNSDDGLVRIVDIRGKVRSRIGAHGAAAPLEEGENENEEIRSERLRLRRETERGSSVVKDLEVLQTEKGWRVISCGFDKSLRIIE